MSIKLVRRYVNPRILLYFAAQSSDTILKVFFLQVLKIAGLSLVLAGIIFLFLQFDVLAWLIHSTIWIILFWSAIIALVVAVYNSYALTRSVDSFVALFLGSMLIRLLLSIVVIGILLLNNHELRLILVLNFFTIYLCFLVFEIYSIIANLRPISNASNL